MSLPVIGIVLSAMGKLYIYINKSIIIIIITYIYIYCAVNWKVFELKQILFICSCFTNLKFTIVTYRGAYVMLGNTCTLSGNQLYEAENVFRFNMFPEERNELMGGTKVCLLGTRVSP